MREIITRDAPPPGVHMSDRDELSCFACTCATGQIHSRILYFLLLLFHQPSSTGKQHSPSFLIVNGGTHAERETALGRLPCGENGEE